MPRQTNLVALVCRGIFSESCCIPAEMHFAKRLLPGSDFFDFPMQADLPPVSCALGRRRRGALSGNESTNAKILQIFWLQQTLEKIFWLQQAY
jgi:hypothetical protein